MSLSDRLTELASMQDGWYDGHDGYKGSLAPTEQSLATARVLGLERPFHLFPKPCGGVQFEASIGAWEVSVEINAEGRVCSLSGDLMDTEQTP